MREGQLHISAQFIRMSYRRPRIEALNDVLRVYESAMSCVRQVKSLVRATRQFRANLPLEYPNLSRNIAMRYVQAADRFGH